jgi:hypothetical protein
MIRILRGARAALVMLALSGAAHANLLSNGNFATGDLTGWASSGDVGARRLCRQLLRREQAR